MFNFLKNLLGLNKLRAVEKHLATADDHLAAHVEALGNAADAAVDHIAEQQNKIAGLSLAIGMAQSQINTAADHLETVNAKLAAQTKNA